jgi:hypothetical protein
MTRKRPLRRRIAARRRLEQVIAAWTCDEALHLLRANPRLVVAIETARKELGR